MADSDFISEIMSENHGTKVLITNVDSEKYLQEHKRRQKIKNDYPQWEVEEEFIQD